MRLILKIDKIQIFNDKTLQDERTNQADDESAEIGMLNRVERQSRYIQSAKSKFDQNRRKSIKCKNMGKKKEYPITTEI